MSFLSNVVTQVRNRLFGQPIAQQLEQIFDAYSNQKRFMGTVLVAQGDEILLCKSAGVANEVGSITNTPETVFRIGSMTKSFTAIALMQLVENNRLSLSDRLSKFLPDYPDADLITVDHLLTNTSGIPDYILMPEYENIKAKSVSATELISLFRDKPLLFSPGSAFNYSNSGWVLIGCILEQLESKPYAEVIRSRIFDPVGMASSGYIWSEVTPHRRSLPYAYDNNELTLIEWIDESTMGAAGGLYSTVDDLYRFDHALHDNKLLKAQTWASMIEPTLEPHYGRGWELHSIHGHPYIGHSGGIPGYAANLLRFVEDDLVVVFLSNLGSAPFATMTETLALAALSEPYELPSAYTFIKVAPEVLSQYVGSYDSSFGGRNFKINLQLNGDVLEMRISGLPKSVLHPLSETKFYTRSKGEVVMTFTHDDAGSVDGIDMIWDKFDVRATRVNE